MVDTINYGLKKHDKTDFFAIDHANENLDLIDAQLKTAQDKADQAFQSASNGKTAIKAAITGVDPEVTIPTDATFVQLAAAIGQIKTGVDTEDATVIAEQILNSMTAYVKGVKVIGTMPNLMDDDVSAADGHDIPSDGKIYLNLSLEKDKPHAVDGYTRVHVTYQMLLDRIINLDPGDLRAGAKLFGMNGKPSVVDTEDANVTAGQMLTGYFGYGNGSKINGNIPVVNPDLGDQIGIGAVSAGAYSGDGQNYAYMQIPNGHFLNGINYARHLEPDLIPQNILSGKSIFGVSGSVTAGKRSASGTTMTDNGGTYFDGDGSTVTAYGIVVSGLTFQPSYIMAFYEYPNNSNPYVIFNTNGVGLDAYGIKILTGYSTVRLASKQINGFKLQGAAYVNATGFNIPAIFGGVAYHWTAIE